LAASDVRVSRRAHSWSSTARTTTAALGIDLTIPLKCLRRVCWKASRFSWWFTSLDIKFPDTGAIGQKLQDAELRVPVNSKAASTALAEITWPAVRALSEEPRPRTRSVAAAG
jgi:p-hydroxybenzoate 3-monooxygenase